MASPSEFSDVQLLAAPRQQRPHCGTEALSHGALLVGGFIYSGYNLLLAACLHGAVSPVGFSVLREVAAVPLLYCWAAVAERPLTRPPPSDCRRFVALGIILCAFQLCFAIGVALTDGQTAAFFQCLEPSTAALLGAAVRVEQLTVAKVVPPLP